MTILARIIRDIPTLGGVIACGGPLLAIASGGPSEKRPKSNRWNLARVADGVVVLSNVRKGFEFELEEMAAAATGTEAVDLNGFDDL